MIEPKNSASTDFVFKRGVYFHAAMYNVQGKSYREMYTKKGHGHNMNKEMHDPQDAIVIYSYASIVD
jgi:hypothetical protein